MTQSSTNSPTSQRASGPVDAGNPKVQPGDFIETITMDQGFLWQIIWTHSDNRQVKLYKPPQTKEERKQKTSWIEIKRADEKGEPVPGEKHRIESLDDSVAESGLDHKGFARVDDIEPGTAKIMFPELDMDAWEEV
jgi:hypothetical protein